MDQQPDNDNPWAGVDLAGMANGLDMIARILGTFYNNLKYQGLPDEVISSLVLEMFKQLLAGVKGQQEGKSNVQSS